MTRTFPTQGILLKMPKTIKHDVLRQTQDRRRGLAQNRCAVQLATHQWRAGLAQNCCAVQLAMHRWRAGLIQNRCAFQLAMHQIIHGFLFWKILCPADASRSLRCGSSDVYQSSRLENFSPSSNLQIVNLTPSMSFASLGPPTTFSNVNKHIRGLT